MVPPKLSGMIVAVRIRAEEGALVHGWVMRCASVCLVRPPEDGRDDDQKITTITCLSWYKNDTYLFEDCRF